MKRIILLLLMQIFFINSMTNAQVKFQKSITSNGNQNFCDFQRTFDSGFIFTGGTSCNVLLAKTDSIGNILWMKSYGGNNCEAGLRVLQSSDSGYIIAGYTESFGSGGWDAVVIKTDSVGVIQWSKVLGTNYDDYCYSVQETPGGEFMVTGNSHGYFPGFGNAYQVRFNAQGDTIWTKLFGGTPGVASTRVIQHTTDGGFILCGDAGSLAYLVKMDSLGTPTWAKTFGGSVIDGAYDAKQTFDGGYIVTGYTYFGAGQNDIFLLKTDSSGNMNWSKTYGGPDYEFGSSVIQTDDGGYIVCGSTYTIPGGPCNTIIVKTNSIGDTIYTKMIINTTNTNGFNKAIKSNDGGYYIAMDCEFFPAIQSDILFIKSDSLGNSGCNTASLSISVGTPPIQVTNINSTISRGGTLTNPSLSTTTLIGNTVTHCSTTSIDENNISDEVIEIFPNPSNGNITIRSEHLRNFNIKIYDIYGQRIYLNESINAKSYSENEIHVLLEFGIYIVQLNTDNLVINKKIIISNY